MSLTKEHGEAQVKKLMEEERWNEALLVCSRVKSRRGCGMCWKTRSPTRSS